MTKLNETWEEREKRRKWIYDSHQGLFLVHACRPSIRNGWFDIVIWLHQHGETGPLIDGKVEKVEYHLGPRFFTHPVIKTDAKDRFQLKVSAYGPMLCLAQVFILGGEPLDLERYCDFGDGA